MIDIAETLQAQAESLAEHHEELLALSVNVANLRELVRVQHSVLKDVQAFDERERKVKWYGRDLDGWLSYDVDAALAKYNEMMGEGNEQ